MVGPELRIARGSLLLLRRLTCRVPQGRTVINATFVLITSPPNLPAISPWNWV